MKFHRENDISDDKKKDNLFEMKLWYIQRFECTLVHRDKTWWNETIADILKFSKDLEFYKKDDNSKILKEIVEKSKKRKKREEPKPLDKFLLLSDDE